MCCPLFRALSSYLDPQETDNKLLLNSVMLSNSDNFDTQTQKISGSTSVA
jgi:hypothetical protein